MKIIKLLIMVERIIINNLVNETDRIVRRISASSEKHKYCKNLLIGILFLFSFM